MVEGLFEFNYEIESDGKEYLNEIIVDGVYDTWFSSHCINVLNKTHCGNGGTTGLIRYALENKKGLLVLVPNVSIAQSKEYEYESNGDVCCVYGGSDKFDRSAMIVVATYDQFPRLMRELADCGVVASDDFWNTVVWGGRLVVVDEYDKLVDESGFRDICSRMTELIRGNDRNAFLLMSATPHWEYVRLLRDCSSKEVKTYTVKYDDDKCGIMLYEVKKGIKDILRKTMMHNKQTVVFYNNVVECRKIARQIGSDSCEILCSKDKRKDVGEFFSDNFNERKGLHFLTSAYFTGCDIRTHIDNCIIIGSAKYSYMAYGDRLIKQMIGRFRNGVSGIHMFYGGGNTEMNNYAEVKDRRDMAFKDLEEYGEEWSKYSNTVKLKQKLLNYDDILNNIEKWRSIDGVKKMLEDTGIFKVYKKKIGEFEKTRRGRVISFKEAKKKIASGENVTVSENDMAHMMKAYMSECGKDALNDVTKRRLNEWWKIHRAVGDNGLEQYNPDYLFNAVGLETFTRYKASFLKSVISYITGKEYAYEFIPKMVFETLDAYAILETKDGRGRENNDIYLIVKRDDFMPIAPFFGGALLYNRSVPPKTGASGIKISAFITLTKDHHSIGGTFSLVDYKEHLTPLRGIPLYDWVTEDKALRLSEVKKRDDWRSIKNYTQNKISELYKDTDKCYRHIISQMDKIDSLIIDIDNGLPFSTFKKIYEMYSWTAYPTISNTTEDWTKFRVIVPLENTLTIEGENNLRILKLLRTWFCHWEDKEHQMASYINKEDFDNRYVNEGIFLDIPQRFVDALQISVKNIRDFKSGALKKIEVENVSEMSLKSLSWAVNYYTEHCPDGVDDVKHKTTFMIGKNLSEEDRALFGDWLAKNHPTAYREHWKTHKF